MNVYIVSDGTGETAISMVRAALVQFGDQNIQIIRNKNVRTEKQVEILFEDIGRLKGFVAHTVVSPQLRKRIQELAIQKGLLCVDLLGPLLTSLNDYFGTQNSQQEAGLLRSVNEKYFQRIEAIEFTVKHDDGKLLNDLDKADIILLGVSRTSKTPLSIFLSHKGWKVANVPLVLNQPIPPEVLSVDQKKIVGLIIDSDSLKRIRRKRLEKFGQDPGGEYASLNYITQEINYALEIYRKHKRWPIFNVTDRALEETATEIVKIVSARMGRPDQVMY